MRVILELGSPEGPSLPFLAHPGTELTLVQQEPCLKTFQIQRVLSLQDRTEVTAPSLIREREVIK